MYINFRGFSTPNHLNQTTHVSSTHQFIFNKISSYTTAHVTNNNISEKSTMWNTKLCVFKGDEEFTIIFIDSPNKMVYIPQIEYL